MRIIFLLFIIKFLVSACAHQPSQKKSYFESLFKVDPCSSFEIRKKLSSNMDIYKLEMDLISDYRSFGGIEKWTESHHQFQTKVDEEISKLHNEEVYLKQHCTGASPNDLKGFQEAIATYQQKKRKHNERYVEIKERLEHYAQQNLQYADKNIKILLTDIIYHNEGNFSYSEINLTLTPVIKTKILKLNTFHTFLYKNDLGGESVAQKLKGVSVSDEYKNNYSPGSSTKLQELRPDAEEKFKISIDGPIKAANVLNVRIAPGAFSNSYEINFKVKLHKPKLDAKL